jgi:N-methylhydantoinase A
MAALDDEPLMVRIGLDIGGTFTDVVLEDGEAVHTAKTLTRPDAPEEGAMEALERVLAAAGRRPADVTLFVHGTTLATNALIERKGAVTALITTDGFRDTLEIGTEGRPDQYDINIVKPAPLVPRRLRLPVPERMTAAGEALVPLDEAAVAALVPRLAAAGVESVAIGFLHAYANGAHERRARDILLHHLPGLSVSLSSEVSPEFREYERISTTAANAYVRPLMARYLARFEARLTAAGVTAPLLLMLSSGGLTSVETAARFPIRLVESGPAGGAIFAASVAQANDAAKVVSFDMGGTTAKIALVDDATPHTARTFEVARVYRFKKGSGLPVRVPVIEMVEIGAGGGSIARIDAVGRLTVGPDSAGAAPGPVAYARGGVEPTVTDANVVTGAIDPASFAGGTMPLDGKAALAAIDTRLAAPMGLAPEAAAFGVLEVVCETMAAAARVHAIESGVQLADRTLIAFGGAAPLQACQMADKLGMNRVIVPAQAGVGSAVGFLRAPAAFEVVRTRYQRLGTLEVEAVNATLAEMEAEARAAVEAATGGAAAVTVQRRAYARYVGQGHEIAFEMPAAALVAEDRARLRQHFDAAYEALYGRAIGALVDVEIVSFVVTASAPPAAGRARRQPQPSATAESPPRRLIDSAAQAELEAAVVARSALRAGQTIPGPALIVEDETTTVVTTAFAASVTPSGDLLLTRREAAL